MGYQGMGVHGETIGDRRLAEQRVRAAPRGIVCACRRDEEKTMVAHPLLVLCLCARSCMFCRIQLLYLLLKLVE